MPSSSITRWPSTARCGGSGDRVHRTGPPPLFVRVVDRRTGGGSRANHGAPGGRRDSVSRGHAVRRLQGVRRALNRSRGDQRSRRSKARSSRHATSLENARYRSRSMRMATSRLYATKRRSASCSSRRFVSRCATTLRRTSRRGGSSMKPSPRLCASSPAKPVVRIVERGPVRVTLEITRRAAGPRRSCRRSSLTAGGDRVTSRTTSTGSRRTRCSRRRFRSPRPIRRRRTTSAWAQFSAATITRMRTKCRLSGGRTSRTHRHVWRGRAQRQQVRLGQAGRQRVAPDAAAHAEAGRMAAAVLSVGTGYRLAPVRLFAGGPPGDWRAGQRPERAAKLNQPLVAFQATPTRVHWVRHSRWRR